MNIHCLVVCVLTFTVPAITEAGDSDQGRLKAEPCAACHGPEGESFNQNWPNLAAQKQGYLERQLRYFRDGQRYDPWMSPRAAALSDADIEDLAAFYSRLR